ncbi:PleD family two-component system response regulator [Chromobacterium sp. IIBBL 290-4]|uniref:response regulator n=1 Tax=Chromobacterium sp. IIBBL 290-4 TaxID=2953890 RepID=UPI0020B65F74|nr:response regulator [Chromobacterium sp. IIBBL 290-4]UTH74622.1 response regulator [Chromobacterium sp. IIBBL 290-4]
MELARILIVDDDPTARVLPAASLQGQYVVREADSGEQALAEFAREPAELVLMDILMPGLSGFDACRQLRELPGGEHVPVVFLSSEISLKDQLEAYDCGGSDFIGKPARPADIQAKVAHALSQASQRRQHESDMQSAMQTAMGAMVANGELGVVMQVLRRSFDCKGSAQLAELLLEGCVEYGLEGCIMIRQGEGAQYRSTSEPISQVEIDVLGHLAGGDKIVQLGGQCALNDSGITLLVKNLPRQDSDRVGRLRDNLALMLDGCVSRLASLGTESLLTASQARRQVVERAVAVLELVQRRYEENNRQTEAIMEEMIAKVEKLFLHIGLSAHQETQIAELMRGTAGQIAELYQDGLDLSAYLHELKQEQEAP